MRTHIRLRRSLHRVCFLPVSRVVGGFCFFRLCSTRAWTFRSRGRSSAVPFVMRYRNFGHRHSRSEMLLNGEAIARPATTSEEAANNAQGLPERVRSLSCSASLKLSLSLGSRVVRLSALARKQSPRWITRGTGPNGTLGCRATFYISVPPQSPSLR